MLFFSVIILILLTCVPITQCFPGIIRKGMQGVSIGLFIVGLLLRNDIKNVLKYIFLVLFFGGYVFSVWQYKQNFFTCFFNVMAAVEFCIYGVIVLTEDSDKQNRIIQLVTVLMMITAITTIIGLIRYPLAVRELGRSVGYAGTMGDFELLKWRYRLNNIAGWSQLYGMVFYVPVAVLMYKNRKEMKYLVAAIFCEICIFMGQVTFAMLLSVFLIFLIGIDFPKKSNQIILWFISLIILTIIIVNIESIFRFLIDYISSHGLKVLSVKLNDLYLLTQKNVSGDALERFMLYGTGVRIFRENPLFGYFFTGKSTEGLFCYHSDFFDMLGFYGTFGILIMIFMISRYIIYIMKYVKDRKGAIAFLFGIFSLFVFNPIWYSPQVFIGSVMIFLINDKLKTKKGYQ